jgi:hypothetical protein
MQTPIAADPVHLGQPGNIPGDTAAPFQCRRCFDGFPEPLNLFAGQRLCAFCIGKVRCTECRARLAMADSDDCEDCAVAHYKLHRGDFGDAVTLGLCNTEQGRTIAKRVLGIEEPLPSSSEPRLPADRHRLQPDGDEGRSPVSVLARASADATFRRDFHAGDALLRMAIELRRSA